MLFGHYGQLVAKTSAKNQLFLLYFAEMVFLLKWPPLPKRAKEKEDILLQNIAAKISVSKEAAKMPNQCRKQNKQQNTAE